jgi:hypothetical protein
VSRSGREAATPRSENGVTLRGNSGAELREVVDAGQVADCMVEAVVGGTWIGTGFHCSGTQVEHGTREVVANPQ